MNFDFDGRHLLVDALCASSTNLNDPSSLVSLLEDIVRKIDMTMILPPITVKFPHATSEMQRVLLNLELEGLTDCQTAEAIREDLRQREEEAYGYSSFVMIAESHISIHTFPELNYFSFDCYSCKWFSVDKVEQIIRDHFQPVKTRIQVLKRRIPEQK